MTLYAVVLCFIATVDLLANIIVCMHYDFVCVPSHISILPILA